MGQVFTYNYSMCKETADGKYLIPDSVSAFPLKQYQYKLHADIFEHWSDYTSISSSKINMGLPVFGAFSEEKMAVREKQEKHNTVTVRTMFRSRVYEVKLDVLSELQPAFKSRVYEIAAHVQRNDTKAATYLSEMLVRDFGTHYVTSVDAGGVFVKLDYVSHSYVKITDKSRISSGATLSFPFFETLKKHIDLHLDVSSSHSRENIQTYRQNVMKLDIFTMGGAPFTPHFNLTDWMEDIPSNMVTIDRYANPLSSAVASSLFPELLSSTTDIVSGYIHNAIEKYVNNNQINIKRGTLSQCNDQNITLCSYYFAGVIQSCQSYKPDQDCSTQLSRRYIHGSSKRKVSLLSGLRCPLHYITVTWYTAEAQPYDLEDIEHFLFGGYYSTEKNNPVTGSKSCKPYFKEHSLFYGNDLVLCLSTDHELAQADAIAFGGFFSCERGNPYAATDSDPNLIWSRRCPKGYARHLMINKCDCDIYVCLESGKFSPPTMAPINIMLPPFSNNVEKQTNQLQDTESDGLRVKGPWGTTLVRSIDGKWEYVAPDNHCAAKRPKTLNLDDEK